MRDSVGHARSLRVLLVNSNLFYRQGHQYYSTFSWVKFPELLAKRAASVTLWAPVIEIGPKESVPQGCFLVDTGSMEILDSGLYQSFLQYLLQLPRNWQRWRRQADKLVAAHDVVIHRVPAPKLSLIVGAARRGRKPIFLMVAGDIRTQAEPLYSGSRWRKYVVGLGARFLQWWQIILARRVDKVYAYSGTLRDKFRRGNSNTVLGRTPHVSQSDFYYRDDTCEGDTIVILRVCWLQRSKGLEDLLAAFSGLRQRDRDVRLRVVGAERSPGYRASLEALAAHLGIKERVEFTGWVSLDAISDVYKSSDIHIVSSLAEGMPRCIMEAGAAGLPQVVTAVGGCPDFLSDGVDAMLVTAGASHEMTEAIDRVIDDQKLRKALIRNGYRTAEKGSFEVEGSRILDDFVAVLDERAEKDDARK